MKYRVIILIITTLAFSNCQKVKIAKKQTDIERRNLNGKVKTLDFWLVKKGNKNDTTKYRRSELNNSTKEKQNKLMKSNNPIVIPRNHKVEEALAEAEKGSLDKMKKLLSVLKNPYENQNNIEEYQIPAPSSNEKYQTFCGT